MVGKLPATVKLGDKSKMGFFIDVKSQSFCQEARSYEQRKEDCLFEAMCGSFVTVKQV